MRTIALLSCLMLLAAIVSAGLVQEKQHSTKKRNVEDIDGRGRFRSPPIPGMVDDQVATAFLKNAAAEEERDRDRAELAERDAEHGEDDEEDDEGPQEIPVALPMSRLAEQAMSYGDPQPGPHRSKALTEDVYPLEDGEGYIPYYPAPDIYFRRRRSSRSPQHNYRKRSAHTPMRDMLRPGALRRKRQIRISDNDLGALIEFLTDLKHSIEKNSKDCNDPAHHSFFRENELNEELGAGSGIDDDYSEEEKLAAPDQEYPVWLLPRNSYPSVPMPQRRSSAFYYPAMVPGQKRSSSPLAEKYRPNLRSLEAKLLDWERGRPLPMPADLPARLLYQ